MSKFWQGFKDAMKTKSVDPEVIREIKDKKSEQEYIVGFWVYRILKTGKWGWIIIPFFEGLVMLLMVFKGWKI